MNPKQKQQPTQAMQNSRLLPCLTSQVRRELFDDGRLIDVTEWVVREMSFGPEARVAMTGRLFVALFQVPRPTKIRQAVRNRGRTVLWLAGLAARHARKQKLPGRCFTVLLPTAADAEDKKCLRVEYAPADHGCPQVLIGFPEEFPIL